VSRLDSILSIMMATVKGMPDPRIVIQLIYAIPPVIFVIQSTYIAESFHSNLPWLFYLFIGVGFGSLSLLNRGFNNTRVTRNFTPDATIGILPYCQPCGIYIFPRAYHCPKCECCTQRHFGHVELTNTCLGHYSMTSVSLGLATSVAYFLYIFFDVIHALLTPDSILNYITGRILLPFLLIPSGYALIQSSIFLFQLFYLIATNGIILESKKWHLFEYFVCQDPKRNPYNRGLIENVRDLMKYGDSAAWPGLSPGLMTDAYCEDFMQYRGLDLKPTIKDPAAPAVAPPPAPGNESV
jgi:hypothetical protein